MSNPLHSYGSDNADVDLATGATIFSESNAGSVPRYVVLNVLIGDGTKDLAAGADTVLTFQLSNGGILADEITRTIPSGQDRARFQTDPIVWINGETLALTCSSDQAGDTDVDVTVTAYDVAPLQPVTSGRTVEVESDGMVHGDVKEFRGAVPADLTDTDKLPVSVQHMASDVLGAGNIADNAFAAEHFAANSLNGKGNWNVDKTGYSLTPTTGLGNQTSNITGNLSGSVGSVSGNVGGNVSGSVGSISGVTFPTNFGDLAISATTGYVDLGFIKGVDAITQLGSTCATASSVALNAFSWIGITVGAVSDKAGFSLAADQSGVTIGTVNAMAGTITTLDALDAAQDSQHSTTQSAISTAQNDLNILTGDDGAILATVQGNYAPAQAGDQMDLVDAPNATAVTAIQNGLATSENQTTIINNIAALPAAVWAIATNTLTTAGTIGKLIVDQFTAVLSAISGIGGGDATLAKQEEILASLGLISGVTGPGERQFDWNLEVGGNPAVGVKVWISTDNPYTVANTIAGPLYTNDSGDAPTMLLNDDTVYYGWRDSSRYNFTNPVQFRYSTANARWELWNGSAYEEWT